MLGFYHELIGGLPDKNGFSNGGLQMLDILVFHSVMPVYALQDAAAGITEGLANQVRGSCTKQAMHV